MAFETNKEAAEWKAAIESRIRSVAESRRPMLPDSVDAKTISAILDLGSMGALWKRVAVYEGMCVLEHITYEKRGNMDYKYHPMMNFQVWMLHRSAPTCGNILWVAVLYSLILVREVWLISALGK